jgi:imidazolonepropionase-like amidohydrolase
VGAEVHVGDGTVIADGVVLVRGDTIIAVGARGDTAVAIPEGATTVDAKGKLVTPGLIGADTSLGLVEIGAESSTTDRGRDQSHPIRAGHDPSAAINPGSSLLRVQAIEGVTTAAVSPSGGMLSGQTAWIDLMHDDPTLVAATGIAIKGSLGQAHAGSRAATLELLRRVLDDARFYRRARAAFDRGQSRELAAHPLDLQALFPVLDRKIPLTVRANRSTDILAALGVASEFKIDVVIIGGAEAWRVAAQLASAKVPVVLTPTSNLPQSFDTIHARLDNAALLAEAGVTVVIAKPGDAHNVRQITQEAGIAVANGLDREAALSALTKHVAEIYGMDKRYGTLAKGKVANVVIWDHDPFELDSRPEAVFIRGESIPLVSRQSLLRERYRNLSRFRP